MLQKVAFGCALLLGLHSASCHEQQVSPETRTKELVGTYRLVIKDGCRSCYPIRSDTLVLHPDGTFDQHLVAEDGRVYDSHGQRWAYTEVNSISLNKRIRWDDRSDPTARSGTREAPIPLDLKKISEEEVLIVNFGSTPEILLDEQGNCGYAKTK